MYPRTKAKAKEPRVELEPRRFVGRVPRQHRGTDSCDLTDSPAWLGRADVDCHDRDWRILSRLERHRARQQASLPVSGDSIACSVACWHQLDRERDLPEAGRGPLDFKRLVDLLEPPPRRASGN